MCFTHLNSKILKREDWEKWGAFGEMLPDIESLLVTWFTLFRFIPWGLIDSLARFCANPGGTLPEGAVSAEGAGEAVRATELSESPGQ